MTGIMATVRRELRAYFFSPLAWALLTFLLVINGTIFALIISFLNDPRSAGGRPLDFFFNSSWVVLLFVVPLLTMRLIAEERSSGSIEVLMTAPVTELQVVVGKYLAALVFFAFLWLPTLAYAGIVAHYSEIDWGIVAAGYLGIFAVGAVFLGVGILASSLARSQVVAGVITFAAVFFLFLVFGSLQSLVNSSLWKEIYAYADVAGQMDDFARGVVDSRHLAFDLSVIVFLLFLTSRTLAAKKWR
jgi:ABC-2 type transport system permease protein